MKYTIASISIIGLVIFLMLSLQPLDVRSDLIITSNPLHDQYLVDHDMDQVDFSLIEIETIYQFQLTHIASSKPIDYVTPSNNPYLYERNWSIETSLIRNQSSNIAFTSELFMDEQEDYHIFIRYQLLHNDKGDHFFDIKFGNQFDVTFHKQWITLYHKDDQYVIGGSGFHYDQLNQGYKLNSFAFSQYFKNPKTLGFFHFSLSPKAITDANFLNIEANLYQAIPNKSRETLTLGFNGFRLNPNQTKYIPQSIQLFYIKETI